MWAYLTDNLDGIKHYGMATTPQSFCSTSYNRLTGNPAATLTNLNAPSVSFNQASVVANTGAASATDPNFAQTASLNNISDSFSSSTSTGSQNLIDTSAWTSTTAGTSGTTVIPTSTVVGNTNATANLPGSAATTKLPASQKASQSTGVSYADDLTLSTTNTVSVLPVTVLQDGTINRQKAGNFSEQDNSRQRSVYGMLMNQLYGGVQSSLLSIQLQVRGDPYWLGQDFADNSNSATYSDVLGNGYISSQTPPTLNSSNPNAVGNTSQSSTSTQSSNSSTLNSTQLSTSGQNSASNTLPSFFDGEYAFVFRFNLPQGYNQQTFAPNLKQSEMYTGVYKVFKVDHVFEGGMYTQTLDSVRITGINVNQTIKVNN